MTDHEALLRVGAGRSCIINTSCIVLFVLLLHLCARVRSCVSCVRLFVASVAPHTPPPTQPPPGANHITTTATANAAAVISITTIITAVAAAITTTYQPQH